MFSNILVPLDGLHLSEGALPFASKLAEVLAASVSLIHVIERDAPFEIHGEEHIRDKTKARSYLEEIAHRSFAPHIKPLIHVHTAKVDDVGESILRHAKHFGTDLIIMCAHGRHRLHRLFVGSIAQYIVASQEIAVLFIQPDESLPKAVALKRLLVPIDEKSGHGLSISAATKLAKKLGASIQLMTAVQTPATLSAESAATGILLPSTTATVLDMVADLVRDSLEKHAAELRLQGLAADIEVARGDPAKSIIESAQKEINLIIMETHGRKGLDAFWAGSIAPRVAVSTHVPILFVPAKSLS